MGVRAWADNQALTQSAIQSVVESAMPTLIQSDIGTIALCVNNTTTCSSTAYTNVTSLQYPLGTPLGVVVPYTQPIIVPPFDAIFGSTLPLSATVVMEAE